MRLGAAVIVFCVSAVLTTAGQGSAASLTDVLETYYRGNHDEAPSRR